MATAADASGAVTRAAGRRSRRNDPSEPRAPGTAWREEMAAKANQLDTLAECLAAQSPLEGAERTRILGAVHAHAAELRDAAMSQAGARAALSGVDVSRCMRNDHAAQLEILRLGPLHYVNAQLAVLQDRGHRAFARGDLLRARLDKLAKTGVTTEADREALLAVLTEVQAEERRSIARVRSFRNVLLLTAGALALGAVVLGVIGAVSPERLPLCFSPEAGTVCPTASRAGAWDIVLVEIVGVLAAGLAAAATLRRVRGTSTPFSVPVALAVLKLPMGALTAVLGLLLMRGEFVPGLSALDSSGQIIAWAIVFGYSQQVFTRFVDDQGQSVLDKVGKSTSDTGADAVTAGAHV